MKDEEGRIDFEKILEDLKSNSKKSKGNPLFEKLREAEEKRKRGDKKAREVIEDLIKRHKTKDRTSWEEIVKRYKKEDK